mmetsp:Transcript_48257/g.105046  ORF Transcript_48257/g.105046 Transcript_48257/m.105046 type:complete len:345 (+) Transcript_48257:227-1261(+)
MGHKVPPQRGSSHCCQYTCGAVAAALVAVHVAFRCPKAQEVPDVLVDLGGTDWQPLLRKSLATHGYAHIKGLFNLTAVDTLRGMAQTYCYGDERKALPLSWGGYSVPAFLELPEFSGARWLLDYSPLHQLLRGIFSGNEYRFASHNDVGCDFVGVWHKDILRGPQRKYQIHDVWEADEVGQRHEIYKVLVYLQDHQEDDRAVKVIPGSHTLRDISLDRGYVAVHPGLGDAVVIDQRISHAGNTWYDLWGSGRIFMQVGFGRANNFTEEFERGTVERQQGYQAKMLKSSQRRGWETALTDAKFFAFGLLFTALPPQTLNFLADIDVKEYALLGRLIFGANAGSTK